MTTTTPTPADHRTSAVAADPVPAAGSRVPFAVVVAGSMLSGLVNTLLLVLVVFAGATEPVITGAGLVGLASGWALLAMFTTRWTSQPQRWAAVPAAVMAVTGVALLAVTPDNGTLDAAGWVWPPAALVLAVWMHAPPAAPRPAGPAGFSTRPSPWWPSPPSAALWRPSHSPTSTVGSS